MSVRVSVGALFVLCCFISWTSAWWPYPHFDEEVPENCPHRNNDTHVCSTLESNTHPCKYRYCCGDYDWDKNEDTDECENGICWIFRFCVNYACRNSCCDGYIGDWQTGCQVDTGECHNGGTRRRGYWRRCNCLPGFTGRRCEIPFCGCNNMGHCVIRDNEPVCECPPGFTGTNCEQPICTEKCLNGGTCVGDGRDGFCVCPEGFVGDQCEHEYINSEKCPSKDPYIYENGILVACKSDEECDGEKVCCNEGRSLICRKPKPTSCNYKGQEHPLNSIFHPEPCMTCECFENGYLECRSVACGMPECDDPVIHDQCCSTCPTEPPRECKHNGYTYQEGESFKDDCNTCTCNRGYPLCTLMGCFGWPELVCPDSAVELRLPPESSSLELTKELTHVKAQIDGRDIQVRFEPTHVHHCRCLKSDDMVYTATAYTSYNGITKRCRFSYIVKDVTPPVFLTCPEHIYVFEHEEVTYKRPEYWDNVGIAKAQCAMDSNRRTYPPGNYLFNYQVMDFEGNHASCSFLLSVTSSDTPLDQLPQGLKNRSSRGPHIAMIVAPIAGLLVVILMIVLFVWCCRFKRASNRASTPQHRPLDAFDNHIDSIPADVKAPDYNSLPPNPPAYHSDNISMHSDYAYLPPPEYKEVEELKAPTGYVNPDYSTIGSVKDSVKSRDA